MFTRSKTMPVPEVGAEAPEFNLPSAQGGQLRLSMRTVRGPVVVAFYRPWSEEDVAYFKELATKEDEINLAAGSVAAIGVAEPDEAREFARATGLKSYVLYDYAKVTSRQWGLLEREKGRGDYTRPAVFIVGPDGNVAHAWNDERPDAAELLAKVSGITGLPKPPEEKEAEVGSPAPGTAGAGEAAEKPKKMSPEERERIKAERRAAREAGKSLKTSQPEKTGAAESAAPKKMSREERERIKAERRAARESGQSLKTPPAEPAAGGPPAAGTEPAGAEAADAGDGAPKKMSREERERIKAERRAAREAGQSLKTSGEASKPETEDADAGQPPEAAEGAKAEPVGEGAAAGEKESPKKPDGKPVEG